MMIPVALRLAAHARPKFALRHPDGSLYLSRTVLWGPDCLDGHDPLAKTSCFIHEIHTSDGDRHLHDHPWIWAVAVILSGGYIEERNDGLRRRYHRGDLNVMRHGDYHTITQVEPDTVTLFICGAEVSDWGFLVDGVHVPHTSYLSEPGAQRMTHVQVGP